MMTAAVFAQMSIGNGAYGTERILSPAAAAAMRRPQIPRGVPSLFSFRAPGTGERVDQEWRAGGYGFGLFVFETRTSFSLNGSLVSTSTFGHAGMGGTYLWVDPEADLVGVYLSVATARRRGNAVVDSDLFMNQVHAAVVD